ncbi:MAG: Rne/Rng family ribonuclease [Candidatus Eisenbacteria bacterium]|uniref:Ribonuclease G n=1 Tax=Eiseniibacteriota bacterium TaxID=2212470 RepID=A0A849SM12_UNCEI|nr:Rne/Rng family ribonuclease [Candidatus Eisenbacteria bacterium]
MKQTIIINADAFETRIAILEGGELAELLVERADQRRNVGDIYKARVNAVLPGMQAAFVDLGLPKTGFLHASDLSESLEALDDLSDVEEGEGPGGRRRRGPVPKIEDHLEKGDEILVQITKESIGTKGPRVTQQVSLPGRYCVLMPGVDHVGVSRRIEDRSERQRIKAIISDVKPKGVGLIARTAGEGHGDAEFAADVKYLAKLWTKIERKSETSRAPAPVHRELEMTASLIRDLFTEDTEEVIIDDKNAYSEIQNYLKTVSPELRDRVQLYKGREAIFDAFGIEAQIEKTFERKVWLKKGGYICVDHAEALVAIDVNTGRFTGKKNQEETIFRTNMEAAKEIPRQLRLRDIGGIIVIDFIDMEIEANKRSVLDELRKELRFDRARTKAFAVSDLGLIEMTRQRERSSLLHYYTEDCPTCGGLGKTPSPETMLVKLERAMRRVSAMGSERRIILKVSPDIALYFVEQEARRFTELEKRFKLAVDLKDDPQLKRGEMRVLTEKKLDITKQVVGSVPGT